MQVLSYDCCCPCTLVVTIAILNILYIYYIYVYLYNCAPNPRCTTLTNSQPVPARRAAVNQRLTDILMSPFH